MKFMTIGTVDSLTMTGQISRVVEVDVVEFRACDWTPHLVCKKAAAMTIHQFCNWIGDSIECPS